MFEFGKTTITRTASLALAGALLGTLLQSAPAVAQDAAIRKALTDWCTVQYGPKLSAANKDACNSPPTSPTQARVWCLKFQTNDANCEADFTHQVTNLPTTGAGAIGTSAGVCTRQAALDKFYRTVPALKRIRDNLDTSIAGLAQDEANFPKSSFGPDKNAAAQSTNRSSLRDYFATTKAQIEARVANLATQSHPDCFNCAVAEKWAILKGAARLLSYTYTFAGGDGLKVGSGDVGVLWKTRDDLQDEAGIYYPKRPIAQRDSFLETTYGPHSTSLLVLDDLSDQWVSSLNPDSIEKLKVELCKIVNTKEKAYSNPDIFFKYAKGVQEEVNRLFTSPDPSVSGKNVVESAFSATMSGTGPVAQNMPGAVKMSTVNNQISPRQCDPAATQMELKAYNEPPFGYHPTFCSLKQYGGTQ